MPRIETTSRPLPRFFPKYTFVPLHAKLPRNSSPCSGERLTHVRCVTAQCAHTHICVYIFLLSFRVTIDRGCNFVLDAMGHLSSRASSLTQKNIWQASLYAVWSHSRHGPRRNTLRFGLIVEFIVLHLCARPFVLKFPALERRTVSVFSEIAARNSIVGEFRSRRNGGRKWSFSLGIRTGYFTNALISTFISGNGRLKFGSDFFGERLRRKKRTFRFFFRSELKKRKEEGNRQDSP